jgi:hypothetical protein
MIRTSHPISPLAIEVSKDPDELERLRPQIAAYDRNSKWLQANIKELAKHRGRFFCVAEAELFIADTSKDATAKARAKYPDALGLIVRYILPHIGPRIYAHCR